MNAYRDLPLLRARIAEVGVRGLSDRELLEALLTYSEPTGAAELTARLWEKYGDLSAVLNADVHGLAACGLREHSVSLLRMLLPAYGRFLRSEVPADTVFDTLDKIGDYFSRCFCGVTVEAVYLLLLRADLTAIDCRRVAVGSVNSANLNTRALVELALFSGAKNVAIAHNHPGGNTRPSESDIGTTVSLKSAFETIGVQLLDHIVVAGNRYIPIMLSAEGLCREEAPPLSD